MNLSSAEYRKLYNDALDAVLEAEAKRDLVQRLYDVEWEIIEASRRDLPGRRLSTAVYIEHKIKLGNIGGRLNKAKRAAEARNLILSGMPKPKLPRKRRTILVDGIRTKLETA